MEVKGWFRKDAKEKWELVSTDYPNSIIWMKPEVEWVRKQLKK